LPVLLPIRSTATPAKREEQHMVSVDLRVLGFLLRLVAVMRDRVMLTRHADLRIRTVVELARHHECSDARDVGLKRDVLQIEHEPDVILVELGDYA